MIAFAPGVDLPDDAVTQTFAFLARRGAGKTYGAKKLAEGMLDDEQQIVIFDPVGVWYGLRLSTDGTTPAYNIPIFGGQHGDVPLAPFAGAMIADLLVDRGISAVLDVSLMRKHERKRFATDFAEQLFHRKKTQRSPMHLFIEEAQVVVPQRAVGDDLRMLGAFEDLVKLGRNFGIGVTLISQRPQAVNKDALNQTEALVVLQTNGAQERKALEDWIVEQGAGSKAIVDELPSLHRGEAFLWSPSWLRTLERIKIGTLRTYDSSATPTAGTHAHAEPRPLESDELEALTRAMSAEQKPQGSVKIEEVRVEVPVVLEEERSVLLQTVTDLGEFAKLCVSALDAIIKAADGIEKAMNGVAASAPVAPKPVAEAPARPQRTTAAPTSAPIGKAERAILTAVVQSGGASKLRISLLSGYSVKSSSFQNALGKLRSLEYITRGGDIIQPTSEGAAALGCYEPMPTGVALQDYWLNRLEKAPRTLLSCILKHRGSGIYKDELSTESGYSGTSSSFQNALGRLRSLELIQGGYGGDAVIPSEELF